MNDFEGAVAVITGGAGGLGLALARAAQARGCKIVLADIRQDALDRAVSLLSAGGEVIGVRTDVSRAADVEALADAAVNQFGRVNLLFNNAGVFAASLPWETTEAEFDWVIGVNQRSVCHGIRVFVPRMIAQGDTCHVVIVSSGAGIVVNPGFCTYAMTKHAVVALGEALWLDLRAQGHANIGVTIAMPGMSRSGIMNPAETIPVALRDEARRKPRNPVLRAVERFMVAGVAAGLPADALAGQVFDAIAANDLYVLPAFDDEANRAVAMAVASGRVMGVNAYPPIVDEFLAGLNP